MSDEELVGKFGLQYKTAKEKLKSLQAQAQLYAKSLESLYHFLNQMSAQSFGQIDTAKQLQEFPSKEELAELLDSLASSTRDKEAAEKELKRLGIL